MDEIEQCPSCGQPFTIIELLGHAESCSASRDAPGGGGGGGGGGGAGSANLKSERAVELVDVDLDTSSILTDGGIQLVMDGSKPDFIDLQVLGWKNCKPAAVARARCGSPTAPTACAQCYRWTRSPARTGRRTRRISAR